MTVSSSPHNKAMDASMWSFSIIASTRVIYYATNIALMAFLAPEDFGLIAIMLSIMAIMNSMSVMGVDAALISHKKDISPLLNDAWTLEVSRGILLATMLFFSSSYISDYFGEQLLSDMLKVISLAFIFQSFRNVGLVLLRKELNFKGLFYAEITMVLTNTIVTLYIVSVYESVWGVVIGYVAGWCVMMLMSYYVHPYRPFVSLKKANFKVLFGYSKWVLIAGQINSFIENGINLFIGSQFGTTVLGHFERADMFTRKTSAQIGEVVWKVGLPALAANNADPKRMAETYFAMLYYVVAIVFPFMSLVYLFVPEIVLRELGEEWKGFAEIMYLLCILAAGSMLLTPSSILFQAAGLPHLGFRIAMLRLCVILVAIFPLSSLYGLNGVVYAMVLGIVVVFPLALVFSNKILKINYLSQLKVICVPLIPSLLIVFLFPIFDNHSHLNVVVNLTLAVFIYAIVVLSISKYLRQQVISVFIYFRSRVKG